MSFEIFFHPKAKSAFEKLGKETQERVRKKIAELKEFPEERGKHLSYSEFWSLRVGDFRVIYELNKQAKRVIVLFIGHRKRVYDDFSRLF